LGRSNAKEARGVVVNGAGGRFVLGEGVGGDQNEGGSCVTRNQSKRHTSNKFSPTGIDDTRGGRQNRCGSSIADGLVDTPVLTSGIGCSKGGIVNGAGEFGAVGST
jgi:hypothetical protein